MEYIGTSKRTYESFITLDEEFKENIKSPIHEDFTYESFSEGEKMRINLAILFTWREIARMKNSINTNEFCICIRKSVMLLFFFCFFFC